MLSEPPVRLCCGQAHWGVVCPDGDVMCCVCFERVPAPDVWEDTKGGRWNMCKACGDENGLPPVSPFPGR